MVKGEDTQYFTEGTEVVITCQNKEFTAYVVRPETLGIPANEEDEPMIYLRLKQPDPTLEDGARGKITIVFEQRTNTLYVDKTAVKTASGETFVYMLDENGMRMRQKVTTGLESGKVIEILSGLKENDSVIID